MINTCFSYLINFIFFLDATVLLQRTAIIQKDEKGYGLTVSGDNPVYVASVKTGELSPLANDFFSKAFRQVLHDLLNRCCKTFVCYLTLFWISEQTKILKCVINNNRKF